MENAPNVAGKYLVIEGNDGTGKSTQVDMLAAWLRERGREVVVVEEPGSDDEAKTTPVANEYRRVLKDNRFALDPEINVLLFSAARRELWFHKIEPALRRGAVVLSSRSYVSTLVYQGYGEGVAEDTIINMTKRFTSERYMSPDFVVVLFADDQTRQQRIAERLGVHRNSVPARLARLRRALGVDIEDAEQRANLWCALHFWAE